MGQAAREHPSSRVRILDDTVVNQIAAGEVVERPASVVKELVENSIDAGATVISIAIENGGRSRIEVLDNGRGMSRDDAVLAVERFATSKLQTTDQLFALESLGFRGEALPSIAAVSRFMLQTSPGDTGTEISLEGGRLRDVRDAIAPRGTRVRVGNLLYNVPARRSFLKSERAEMNVIKALVGDFAVGYPSLTFTLASDGTEILNLPPASSFAERVKQLRLAGRDPLSCDEELNTPAGCYRLQAVLSKPIEAVQGGGRLRLIVNGRVVRDRILLRAVKNAFGAFLKGDQYPIGVLSLSVPPSEVDVNVHPQKSEVRFRSPDRIFILAERAITNQLRGASLAVPIGDAPERPLEPIFSRSGFVAPAAQGALFREDRSHESIVSSERNVRSARFIGQVFECYLLFELRDEVLLVDMHAAHERVTYARLNRQFREREPRSQLLLAPETIPISADRLEVCRDLLPLLSGLGFDIDLLGDESLLVRAVPDVLARISPRRMVDDLLGLGESAEWVGAVERRIDGVLARIACHGSIRSGQSLSAEEAYELLDAIESAEVGAFCPHGRPVMRSLRLVDFEAMFGRI